MTTLTQAVEILEGLDPADVAGLLTSSSVPDAPTELEALRARMTAEGLDTSMLPAPSTRSPVFDFAVACRAVETKRGKFNAGERVAVGEVVANGDEAVYQITREMRDEANRVIEHRKGMRVVYDKAFADTDPIRVEPFAQEHYEALSHLEAAIRARFLALRGTIPGAKVREIVRKQFKLMGATRWTSKGSVWFVPVEHVATLEAMERVLVATYGADTEFTTIPLPRSPHTSRTVEKKVGAHTAADADALIGEIGVKLADGAEVRNEVFERLRDKANDVRAYVETMEAMLGGEVALAQESLRLVDAQLMEMLGRVKK